MDRYSFERHFLKYNRTCMFGKKAVNVNFNRLCESSYILQKLNGALVTLKNPK